MSTAIFWMIAGGLAWELGRRWSLVLLDFVRAVGEPSPARLGLHERLPCDGEAVRLSGVDDNGDPTSVYVETCRTCGALIDVGEVDMVDHHLAAHPMGRVDTAS